MLNFKSCTKQAKNKLTLFQSKSESILVTKIRIYDELYYEYFSLNIKDVTGKLTVYNLNSWNQFFPQENFKLETFFQSLFLKDDSEIDIGKYTISLMIDYSNIPEDYLKFLNEIRVYLEQISNKYEYIRQEVKNYYSIIHGIESNTSSGKVIEFILWVNKLFLLELEDEKDNTYLDVSIYDRNKSDDMTFIPSTNKNLSRVSSFKSNLPNLSRLSKISNNDIKKMTEITKEAFLINNENSDNNSKATINYSQSKPRDVNAKFYSKDYKLVIDEKVKKIVDLNSNHLQSEIDESNIKKASLMTLLNFSIKSKPNFSDFKINCCKEYCEYIQKNKPKRNNQEL
jgi:hypothetical protein